MARLTLKERLKTRDLRVEDSGALLYAVTSFMHYGLRAALGKRVERDLSQVMNEYDQETRSEHWKTDIGLEDLVLGDNLEEKWILKDSKLVRGTVRDARRYLLDRLGTRIEEFLPDGQGTVVEFGCGTGRNLLYLARRFPNLELIGIEITPKTVERARHVASENGMNVTFLEGDMTSPPAITADVDVVYSIHALEQLPRSFALAVDAMLGLARRGVVLFEPVHELFPRTIVGLAGRFRIYNADYLDGLLGYLKEKGADIVKARALATAGYPLNRTTEIVIRTV
ncbi:MAG: class I SAM-dependent methyltransferase [Myxococcales bacterium]|nr:class I SAM-dependent methyltransferase [Myxococcales bacterium]